MAIGEEPEDAFKVTPPGWVKKVFVSVSKWGPDWVIMGLMLWFLWTNGVREASRSERREDALIEALQKLGEPVQQVQRSLNDHMGTSYRTQLFISVMCANNANTSAQRRACFDDYYAQQMKDKEISR